MFRTILRLVASTSTPSTSTPSTSTASAMEEVSLEPPRSTGSELGIRHVTDRLSPERFTGNHRERLWSMQLEHTRICGAKCCERLRKANIFTAGDLASCDPNRIAKQLRISRKALALLKRHRSAIHLAASIPGMMPADATLLIGIHRGDIHSLAMESAGVLHRDLERFALSTAGAKMFGKRRVPSLRKVKRWLSHCREQTQIAGLAAA